MSENHIPEPEHAVPDITSQEIPGVEQVIEPTVAVFADRRAAPLLLRETVDELIAARGIKRGLVDISSIPGLAIADAFVHAGIPFDSIEFGQERVYETVIDERHPFQNPYLAEDAERIRSLAASEVEVNIGQLAGLDANLVLAPAVIAPGEQAMDFSPQSIVGVMVQQITDRKLPMIIIDVPERGLVVGPHGEYLRRLLHVAATTE